MPKYEKALVTGGAGFVGAHLSKRLLEMGLKVWVIDNLTTGTIDNVPSEAKFYEGNIVDVDLAGNVLDEGIDIVFHNAARVTTRGSVDNFYEDAHNNVLGTLNLLRACKNSNVRKFVFASSMAVYGDCEEPIPVGEDYRKTPRSPYGISKLACEMYMETVSRSLGIGYVALRYFNVYGPGQALTPYGGAITIFVNNLFNGNPLEVFGDGNQCRDFVHVDDIIQGNIKAMEAEIGSGIFNIGTGHGTTINDVAKVLMERLNSRSTVLYSRRRHEELINSVADISRAREILGFAPLFKFPDKIDSVIESIQ